MTTLRLLGVDDEKGMRLGIKRALEDYTVEIPEINERVDFDITLAEYLEDYASDETKAAGRALIQRQLASLSPQRQAMAKEHLEKIVTQGQRDVYL